MAMAGHFHVHDEGSPLDGGGNRNQLTKQAVKMGHTHLGCTNHGRLGTVLDHVHACRHPEEHDDPDDPSRKRSKDERLIPIAGIEAFWRPDRFMDLTDKERFGKNGHNWAQHLCIHAGSLNGWRTLMRLSSKSWVPRKEGGGFYGKACFDWDMLENDHEDLVISTACLSSPLSHLILQGDESGAKKWLKRMCRLVGDDKVFLEIMPHDLDAQRTVNIEKMNLAYDLGLPTMVTGDVHVPYKEWADTQSIIRMAAYGSSVAKEEKKKDAGEEVYTELIDTLYLSSEDELKEMFEKYHPDIPAGEVQEAIDNTNVFAKKFKGYVHGKTVKLPKISKSPDHAERTLRAWCEDGLRRIDKRSDDVYWDRFEYEFKVLKDKDVLDYFILVGDFVRWAKSTDPLPPSRDDPKPQKKRPIRVGLGRGSAAGSLISYLIGITAIDPISWGLLFERFLNPDRAGLPDIDIDFETDITVLVINGIHYDGRELVKEYIKRKVGHDHVADIIAYQTFAPRVVIKDVASTQDVDFREIRKVTDSIGDTERDLEKLVKDNEVLAKFRDDYPEIWKHCLRLEGQILRDSRHAGGVVITDKPTTFYMPTQIGGDERSVVTAWADRADFPIVSDYGFVKMDILGVRSLTKQEICVQMIGEYYDVDFEPNDLPVLQDPYASDQEVIDAFVHGHTVGIFQFGSRGITQLLRHIKPDNAIDISVANALFRPGPIKIAFEYGDRKNGATPITYWHDALEPILGETLGLMCFQEQAMEVVKQLAGFSGGDADKFRKIMSKLYRLPGDKAQEVMQGDHDRFVHGCMTISGLPEEVAEEIWTERMLPLGNYLFNKSHSSSYGLQAYQDQHMKVNYPLAFYAADLTITKKAKKDEQIDYLKRVMREAAIYDVQIAPPDINTSRGGWSIDNGKIRWGLVSINGMGQAAANEVIEHRPFKNYRDYIRRMPSGFSTASTVSLVKAGAFDDLGEDRSYLLGQTPEWPETTAKLTIEMTCGCKKTKTVKVKDVDELDDAIDDALDVIVCKKHPDAQVNIFEEIDPNYPVAAFHKKFPGVTPDEFEPLSEAEVLAAEGEVLNIPLTQRNMSYKYNDYIAERIFSEEEIEALPAKPNRSKGKHNARCQCKDCKAAECVVGGEVTAVKVIETKKQKQKMAFVDVEFGVNKYSVTLFPEQYKQFHRVVESATMLMVAGHRDDRGQILAYDVQDVIDVAKADGYEPEAEKPRKKRTKIRRKVAA